MELSQITSEIDLIENSAKVDGTDTGLPGESDEVESAVVIDKDDSGENIKDDLKSGSHSESEEDDWEASVPISAPKQVEIDESNALEIWNFPSYYTKKELESLFGLQVEINWIDDTSAIIRFSTPQDLKRGYLQLSGHPTIKHKIYIPMEKRDRSSRPKTTDMVARRMIAGALGMQSRLKKTASEKEEDSLKLRLAREEKETEIKRKAEEKDQRLKASSDFFDS